MTLILDTSGDKSTLDALRERVQRAPDSKLFMPLAEELRRRGQYGEAVDLCMQAKLVHPRYVSSRILLCKCLMELGMREEARREMELVLELDRENVFSLRIMAEIHRAQGSLEEATNYYRAALRLCPSDTEAREKLGALARLAESVEGDAPASDMGSATPDGRGMTPDGIVDVAADVNGAARQADDMDLASLGALDGIRFSPDGNDTRSPELDSVVLGREWDAASEPVQVRDESAEDRSLLERLSQDWCPPEEPVDASEATDTLEYLRTEIERQQAQAEPSEAGTETVPTAPKAAPAPSLASPEPSSAPPPPQAPPESDAARFFDYVVRQSDFTRFAAWIGKVQQKESAGDRDGTAAQPHATAPPDGTPQQDNASHSG
ncbi:MAG: tetratricopeptide repeat protein [Candidatus Eisenbacteria bacterium]